MNLLAPEAVRAPRPVNRIVAAIITSIVASAFAFNELVHINTTNAHSMSLWLFRLWIILIAAGSTLWIVSVRSMPADGTATARERHARERLRHAEAALEDALTQLQKAKPREEEQDRLALPELWEITHSRLALYHEIATTQARRSFRNAQIAMAAGFVLLLFFATLATSVGLSTTASVVTGLLGTTSAALAGYIGRTFVRSQETSASHLRAYFDQPLEFSRYLAAERLLSSSEMDGDKQVAILGLVISAMLTPSANAAKSKEEIV